MNFISTFLNWCAGVSGDILNNLPLEKKKYNSVGITILFTGIFASLSGGYAIFKIFNSFWVAVLFGFLWGFMIFNLDRYIVMSIKKTDNFSKELITAIPRIILALIISLVVAKPLEVRIFQDRIKRVIATNKLNEKENDAKKLDSIYGKSRITGEINTISKTLENLDSIKNQLPKSEYFKNLNTQKTQLNNTIESKSAERKQKQIKISNFFGKYTYLDTLNGRNLRKPATRSFHIPLNAWNKIKPSVNERVALDKEIKNARNKLSTIETRIQEEIKNHKDSYQDKIDQSKTVLTTKEKEKIDINMLIKKDTIELREINRIAFSENFISQLEALGELTEFKKGIEDEDGIIQKADNTMYWTNLSIILLFIVIETAPIFVKLITPKGAYDTALEALYTKEESTLISDSNIHVLKNEKKEDIALFKENENEKMEKRLLAELLKKWENKKKSDIQNINTQEDFQNMINEIMNSQNKS